MAPSQDPRPLLYMVRCNFHGPPDDEVRWNDWYSGPKTEDMLKMPMFISGQRYRAAGLEQDVRYLAIWQLHSPSALQTPRYLSRWGFGEWKEAVGDWSRDLLLPTAPVPWDAISADTGLTITAFNDQSADHSQLPKALWCTSIGLDRTWPWVAIEQYRPDGAAAERPLVGVAWRTVYEPITADASSSAGQVRGSGRR